MKNLHQDDVDFNKVAKKVNPLVDMSIYHTLLGYFSNLSGVFGLRELNLPPCVYAIYHATMLN